MGSKGAAGAAVFAAGVWTAATAGCACLVLDSATGAMGAAVAARGGQGGGAAAGVRYLFDSVRVYGKEA